MCLLDPRGNVTELGLKEQILQHTSKPRRETPAPAWLRGASLRFQRSRKRVVSLDGTKKWVKLALRRLPLSFPIAMFFGASLSLVLRSATADEFAR